MPDPLIKVEHVYKKFCKNLKRSMAYGVGDAGRAIFGLNRSSDSLRPDEFWALKDISFTLEKGEILGIIGANGAGKSTLLRVLNGILPPDSGRVELRGHVGGLISLGVGFHPYLSGRENIHLNGTILGMKKSEIAKQLDAIIDFADIGDFVEAPVATYSSGMYARLAFAIAIHCVPDILLIDEVLSVGDMSFQNKCLRKISELRRAARGVIFVGHNMDMMETICDRAILLREAAIYTQGSPLEVVSVYRSLSRDVEHAAEQREFKRMYDDDMQRGIKTESVTFIGAGLENSTSDTVKKVMEGDDLQIYFEFEANTDIKKPQVGLGLSHPGIYPWNVVYDSNISNKTIRIPSLKAGRRYRISATFAKPNLIPGVYRLNAMIRDAESLELYHHLDSEKMAEFHVQSREIDSFVMEGKRPSYNSLVNLDSQWSCEEMN